MSFAIFSKTLWKKRYRRNLPRIGGQFSTLFQAMDADLLLWLALLHYCLEISIEAFLYQLLLDIFMLFIISSIHEHMFRGTLQKICSRKVWKIHKKTPVLKLLCKWSLKKHSSTSASLWTFVKYFWISSQPLLKLSTKNTYILAKGMQFLQQSLIKF